MIRVVVVDDERLVREGIRAILGAEPGIEVVGEADDGLQAVAVARDLAPDVVLMDIGMPRMDGIEATRHLVRLPVPPKVVVLTTFDADRYVYDALRAGASGFLLKDLTRQQLRRAIEDAHGGERLLAPEITRRLVERFCTAPPPSSGRPAALSALTERELDVFDRVARGRSNAEIAADLTLTQSTVKTHVAHIQQKLGLDDRAQVVVVAYETGYLRAGDR